MHELIAIDVCIMCACESMTCFVHCISVLWFNIFFESLTYTQDLTPLSKKAGKQGLAKRFLK